MDPVPEHSERIVFKSLFLIDAPKCETSPNDLDAAVIETGERRGTM